jgi:hypothetical protein
MLDRMAHDKLGLLACQGKAQKRLVVELMSLLEVLQQGCQAGLTTSKPDWEKRAFQGVSRLLVALHYL